VIYKFKTEDTGIGFDFNVEFEQNQKINCIIGKNGIGKTQLLENIAKSLLYSHDIFRRFSDTHRLLAKNNILEIMKNLESNTKVIFNNCNSSIRHTLGDKYATILNPDTFKCSKPIVFIGAKNRGFTNNIDPDNIKILGSSKNRFVDSLKRTLNYLSGIGLEHEEIADWFVSRLIVNPNFIKNDENKTNEVMTLLKLIEKLEPSLKLVTDEDLKIMFDNGELLINDIPLDKLSTGFVSVIKIFQEIIAGYGGWSNQSDLSQVDGIVFIDEIEPHLHISWQTKIINILKEFFPKTTFYITTHSPLVLAGLKGGEAYELYKDDNVVKTKKIENIDKYFLNDIVNEFFGVDLNQEKIDNPNMEKQQKGKKALLNLIETLQEDK
jgi:ABC-type cobalamin/Fe3+-siderophores transport system ATPase subunit